VLAQTVHRTNYVVSFILYALTATHQRWTSLAQTFTSATLTVCRQPEIRLTTAAIRTQARTKSAMTLGCLRAALFHRRPIFTDRPSTPWCLFSSGQASTAVQLPIPTIGHRQSLPWRTKKTVSPTSGIPKDTGISRTTRP